MKSKKSGENNEAKVLWAMKEARDEGVEHKPPKRYSDENPIQVELVGYST